MSRLLIGVTGSVAAVRTDDIVSAFAELGHDVRIVLTRTAEFFLPHWAGATCASRFPAYRDRDEWPATGWSRGDQVLHIELGRWADAFIISPLDAHTLAKWAQGLADNLLTSTLRAWDYDKPLIVAPAMNTRMWENPITRRHFAQILSDRSGIWPEAGPLPSMDVLLKRFDTLRDPVTIVMPIEKSLACGDFGMGAMAEVDELVKEVQRTISGRQLG